MSNFLSRMLFEAELGLKLALPWGKGGSALARWTTAGSAMAITAGLASGIVVFSVLAGCKASFMDSARKARPNITISQASPKTSGGFSDFDLFEDLQPWMSQHPEARVVDRFFGTAVGSSASNQSNLSGFAIIAKSTVPPGWIEMDGAVIERMGLEDGGRLRLVGADCGAPPPGAALMSASGSGIYSFKVRAVDSTANPAVQNVAPNIHNSTSVGSLAPEMAQRIFNRTHPCWLEVSMPNADAIPAAAKNLESSLVHERYLVESWAQAFPGMSNELAKQKAAFMMVMAAVLGLACLQMVLAQSFSAQTMKRNIASLRTMGASRSSVARIFFVKGFVPCLIGIGAGLGLGASLFVYLE